jgi:hypothetical protein
LERSFFASISTDQKLSDRSFLLLHLNGVENPHYLRPTPGGTDQREPALGVQLCHQPAESPQDSTKCSVFVKR